MLSNHPGYDATVDKVQQMKGRASGSDAPHPFVIGTDAVVRSLNVMGECAQAQRLRFVGGNWSGVASEAPPAPGARSRRTSRQRPSARLGFLADGGLGSPGLSAGGRARVLVADPTALPDERIRLNAAGHMEVKRKTPWHELAAHPVMCPLEFMQWLAALLTRAHQ